MKEKQPKKNEKYIEAVGKRKTSVARVRIFKGGSGITINGKHYKDYFPGLELQNIVEEPYEKIGLKDKISVTVHIEGGGIHSQAEALRHGLSRALVLMNIDHKYLIKKAGFLTRDSRVKERRKFGLKKARRAPQWQKR